MKLRTLAVLAMVLAGCSSSSSRSETSTDGSAPSTGDGGRARLDGGTSTKDGGTSTQPDGAGTSTHDGASSVTLSPTATKGLTKVLTGEYATHFLIKGTIYAFGGSGYEGITMGGIPAVSIDVPAGTTFIDGQSGLHQSLGLDSTGHVWTWGDNWYGDEGNGVDGGGTPGVLPFRIVRDNVGNPFDGVVSVTAGTEADGAIKGDGTVWVWGDCENGLAGNGITTTQYLVYPTEVPIPFPSGVKATKFLLSTIGLVLASDGSVWAWGGGGNDAVLGTGDGAHYPTPEQVKGLPSDIVDIAQGDAFSYALTSAGDLYGWGYYGLNIGLGNWVASTPSCYGPTPTPVLLTKSVDGGAPILPLPKPVKKVVADTVSTHVILSDGTLWGWGDDAQGEVGDGQELDYWHTAIPFAWDWGQCELPVQKPVQIAKDVKSPFVDLWSNSTDTFYTYAITEDEQLYSWGRNKTGDLGNGILAPNTQEAAMYPNSWDVLTPQPVAPLLVTTPKTVEAPYCVTYADAGSCLCNTGKLTGC